MKATFFNLIKTIILVSLLILVNSLFLFSCKKEKIENCITGKWVLTHRKIGDEPVSKYNGTQYYEFKNDNKYIYVVHTNIEYGEWKISKNKIFLKRNDNYEYSIEIDDIKKNKLVLKLYGRESIIFEYYEME